MRQGNVVVPNKVFMTVREMRSLAYKKIFEGLNYFEETNLEKSITNFHSKANTKEEERNAVKSIIGILIMNEEGGWQEMKDKVKTLKLDYKTIYAVE